jgi:hypothetical protein
VSAVLRRIALAAGSTVVALGLAEGVLRLVPARPAYETYFEDDRRERIDYDQALARGIVQPFAGGPRPTSLWAAGSRFHICYKNGRRPGFDERGCVEIRISHANIRDERETPYAKPPGQWRVACLGDSFTFGWGVPESSTWVRLAETQATHAENREIRFINCGASGAIFLDEYWTGLRDRFCRFEPDAVVVSICLNDVVHLANPLGLAFRPMPQSALRLWDVLCAGGERGYEAAIRRRLEREPGHDWGRFLLDAVTGPDAEQRLRAQRIDPTCYWGSGVPQGALRSMRDWCQARGIRLGVVIWPLFQGLEDAERYPFTTIHRVVREFCEAEALPVLDLLPHFLGQDPLALWVDWSDQHGNERAHALAAAPIARFVAALPAHRGR